MKKSVFVLVCGLAAILLTAVLFLTIVGLDGWEEIHYLSLAAIVATEVVTTLYAWSAKGSPRKVAATLLSAVMIPFSVLLSIIYIASESDEYGKYLGWYFAGTIIVNTICWILAFVDSKKKVENDSMQAAKNNMLMLRKLVKSIMAMPGAQAYQKELIAIEEKLHFSNDCVICAGDEQIRLLLLQLQEKITAQDPDCQDLLAKIKLYADQRSIMTATHA